MSKNIHEIRHNFLKSGSREARKLKEKEIFLKLILAVYQTGKENIISLTCSKMQTNIVLILISNFNIEKRLQL